MEYLHSLFDTKFKDETAITVGKFDGVHKGHHLLTEEIISKKQQGFKSCMITFSTPPRETLLDEKNPSLITNKEKVYMLEQKGLDYLIEAPFDDRLMHTDARSFIEFLVNNLNMKYMVSGSDFTFGNKGAGDVKLLHTLSKELGFEYKEIAKIKRNDVEISSTYIRSQLVEGNIDIVNDMLGYEYFVWGEVVHGAHLGTKIGIPTINVMPESSKLVPRYGVYVTTIDFDGRIYHGVTNVGTKPSVSDENVVGIETNILDYNGNLYGRFVKITFKSFLRPEMKFSSVEELKAQMEHDKKVAKDYFNR